MENLDLITAHLGHGCSIAAIKNGESLDTSMGFSPLEGLMMGSRSGDIDPNVINYMLKVNKFQKQMLFFSIAPQKRNEIIFWFLPYPLKRVKSKKLRHFIIWILRAQIKNNFVRLRTTKSVSEIYWPLKQCNYEKDIFNTLNTQSGFGAVSGVADSRDLEDLYFSGNTNARLAVEMFCYKIAKTMASYFVPLEGMAMLVLEFSREGYKIKKVFE